ncbi:uncharacterized protein An07g00830 [Aspergillus niger]|uniref:Contig An07c0020, genomic contig n=2 Tax=Aspergillus niger TaxID=5061 RepID=A2QM52_ASPNC|nr:uncharacterized protein An07g00830 [Aspergillus niger]CAK96533.1 unnamed protein product [Aspergillus niger]
MHAEESGSEFLPRLGSDMILGNESDKSCHQALPILRHDTGNGCRPSGFHLGMKRNQFANFISTRNPREACHEPQLETQNKSQTIKSETSPNAAKMQILVHATLTVTQVYNSTLDFKSVSTRFYYPDGSYKSGCLLN